VTSFVSSVVDLSPWEVSGTRPTIAVGLHDPSPFGSFCVLTAEFVSPADSSDPPSGFPTARTAKSS